MSGSRRWCGVSSTVSRPAGRGRCRCASCSIIRKTVVLRHEEGRPVWNATLAQVAIDYGFTVELCTPYQPQQKGAVENLVGFVKRASLPGAPLYRSRDGSTPAADRLARRSEHRSPVSRDQGDPRHVRLVAEQARLKTPRGGAGRVWPALSGHRRPHGDGHVPGDSVRDAGPPPAESPRRSGSIPPASRRSSPPGANMKRCMPASHFPREGTVSYLPGQRAAPARGRRRHCRKRLVLHARALARARGRGRGLISRSWSISVRTRGRAMSSDSSRSWKNSGTRTSGLVLQRALFQHLIGAEYVLPLVARVPAPTPRAEAVS